ncbi:GTPase Obg [Gracilariopsis chorda]|uniref:GTPase Obg n=1 Tax=Gracilariopsis chorda TaxID=448386 RepID=A0A2V3II81_9FLOR|nr:GTPase Obg [Gracilariopsis chorda]|eukprot:PXF41733.1 GTPase Obg [Gracilariopsis chorda]
MALAFVNPTPLRFINKNSPASRRPRTNAPPTQAPLSSRARAVISTPQKSSPTEHTRPRYQTPTTTNSDWMFFDVARVLVKAGRGGDGCVAFRREKGVPRGGPAGGSGGRGGSIIFSAKAGANTLSKFRTGAAFRAEDGANGQGKSRHGEAARDVHVSVPLGTVVRSDDGRILADLSRDGQTFCAARGGRGGRGNQSFKTQRNRAPRIAENGEPGVQRRLRLELKLVADVALVGFPNAGKSTLLDSISNARPKIADYPFTTIVPNLGVVDSVNGGNGLVIADVPGLIEGAHRGVGMGVSFLRHVERSKVVVHILDGTADDVIERYNAIRLEMELFDVHLARKKEVVLLNKADIPGVQEKWNNGLKKRLVEAVGTHKRIALISAKSKLGLSKVLPKLKALVDSVQKEDNIVILGDEDEEGLGRPPAIVECNAEGGFIVSGYKVERAFEMTNWDYVEAIDRFQRILSALGVNEMLVRAGAKDGDVVSCFGREFDYYKNENIYSAAAALDGYYD